MAENAHSQRFFQTVSRIWRKSEIRYESKDFIQPKEPLLWLFFTDSLGKKGVIVPDLQGDFEFDLVGVNLDPFLYKRNAILIF